ncbi:MAG: glycosyltransferase, partial [Patescibacteria group bacterium]
MPRRILIFSLFYYPRHVGGAEVAVKEITDRIPESKCQFDMVTIGTHGPAFERVGNVNVYRVGPLWLNNTKIFGKFYKYLFALTGFLKAIELHKKNKYDAIWSIMANYAGFGALFFKNKFKDVLFILTLQEGDPLEYIEKRVGILKPLFKKIFKKADLIQAISSYLGVWAKSMGYTREVVVIPNAVDFPLFATRYNGDELSALEEKFEKNSNDIFIITTSRLVKKNAVDVVIKSLSYLPKNFKFLILGVGDDEKKLKELTRKLNLEERVKFLGYVPHSEMPKYLQVSDVFTRPSRSEGLGNSFLEAMAS